MPYLYPMLYGGSNVNILQSFGHLGVTTLSPSFAATKGLQASQGMKDHGCINIRTKSGNETQLENIHCSHARIQQVFPSLSSSSAGAISFGACLPTLPWSHDIWPIARGIVQCLPQRRGFRDHGSFLQ